MSAPAAGRGLRPRRTALRLLLGGLAAGSLAHAAVIDDFASLSLEDLGAIKVPIVVGASKHRQKATEAPSAVSVVTQEDIRDFGYRTLGDLLRGVRGFYVTSDRQYNYTGLRGFNRPGDFGGRVLINIDGHRLNEPLYDSAFTGTDFLLDLDLVERVEIIRGPGSSLYGNNAFFTVINVVTRRGRDLDGGEVSGSAGSLGTYTGRFSYGRQFQSGLEVLVSGSFLESDGQRRLRLAEMAPINGGVAEDLDATTARSGYASLGWHGLTLAGGFMERTKRNPTGQYGSLFNDPRGYNFDGRAYAELRFERESGSGWGVQSRLYWDRYRYGTAMAFAGEGSAPPVVNSDYGRAEWAGAELLATKSFGEQHRLAVGGEFRDDFHTALRNYDVAPPADYVDSRRRSSAAALYAQVETELRRGLTLNTGLRHDRLSRFGATTNPRAALNWQPWRGGTLKALYGEAFRAPNAYEADYIQPTFMANPNLRPEAVRSQELVIEQNLPGGMRASFSLFRNQVRGLITQVYDPDSCLNCFDNVDFVEARGVEVETEGRWSTGLRARASYTYSEARDTRTRRILDNSPRHVAKGSVAVPLGFARSTLGLEGQAMSRRSASDGSTVGAHTLLNLTLHCREFARGFALTVGVQNLLNRDHRDPVSPDFSPIYAMPQDGRTVQAKLTRRF